MSKGWFVVSAIDYFKLIEINFIGTLNHVKNN